MGGKSVKMGDSHNTHAATLDVKKPGYFPHILYREGIESV
jgi:hypothetical protein